MRAFLRFCPLMGSSHIAGLKIACWDSRPRAKKLAGARSKAALYRGGLSKGGALAGMSGVAVGAVPAEASCPRVAGVPGGNSPAKKRAFLRMTELSGVAPRPKGLGAKAFTLEAAYPSKGVTCATASAWVISASPLSKSSRRYFQLPMPSSCIYES